MNKIINFSYQKNTILINDIEIGFPSYGLELVQAIIKNLTISIGIYHITNSGEASIYQYAKHILLLTNIDEILSITNCNVI